MGKLHRDEVFLIKLVIGCTFGIVLFFAFAVWRWPLP